MLRKVSIDIIAASKFAILLFVLSAVVFCVPFFLLWTWKEIVQNSTFSIAFLIALVLGVPLHEGIHGLTWGLVNRSFKPVSFGVMWKYLTPYCHYSEPMPRNHYIWGAITPFIFVGLIPAVSSLFIGNIELLLLGLIYISGAAGDLWMIWLILKEDPNAMILDHPSEAGFFIIDNEETT